MKAHLESALEEHIEAHLLGHGWQQGDPSSYSRALGLDTVELLTFLGASQHESWAKLVGLHGSPDLAQSKFERRLADELTSRGVIDVLRRGVKDLGVHIDLAYFAPAHNLTPELRELYGANRLSVTRQVHHSESNPSASVDLVLFVNGIPLATAELKTQTTGQDVHDAIRQYREERNPADLIFRGRSVVNFAVDQDNVYVTTRLALKHTVFLPFNQGSNGPGVDGGKGNPLNAAGHRTAYLWEQVWDRDNWLDVIGSFVHVEQVRDKTGKKTGESLTVFPRYHQWDAVTRLLAVARDQGPGHNKLVQHSAGSGKSNTIAWLAHRLSRLHTPGAQSALGEGAVAAGLSTNEPVFDKVIIVTDRVVLDRQLQDTVASFDHTPGMIVKIDEDSAQLRQALEGKQARIIITTLQKFPADGVEVVVEFTRHPMYESNAESWALTPRSDAAWTQDWLQMNLAELATADQGSCCGHGNYILKTNDTKHEWGASGAGYQVFLTLSEAIFTAATWEGLKWVAKEMADKIRERAKEQSWDPNYGERRLSDESAEWSARSRIQLRRNTGTPDDLVLKSVATDDHGGYSVTLLDDDAGISYEVEVTLIDGLVEMSRIRKVSYD